MSDPILKAAKAYLQAGYNVLPVDADKRPVIAWKGLQERFPSDEEVASWYPDGHTLNVAVLTGPVSGNLAVLDIDDRALAARMLDDPALVASTVAIRTPRGGLHLWVVETGGPSTGGPLCLQDGRKIGDLKAKGGYALGPPSRTADGVYRTLSKGSPLKVDNARVWALSLLEEYGVQCGPGGNGKGPADPLPKRIEQGRRNELLTSLAGSMRRRGASREAIEAALLTENEAHCDPPLSERDIRQIARSVGRYEPARQDGNGATPMTPPPFEAQALAALLAETDTDLDAIIGDGGEGAILTTDGKGFVAGPTGVGKTNMLLRLSRCLCEGSPFLGLPIPSPRRVLYVMLEGSRRGLRRRLHKAFEGANTDAQERFTLAFITLNIASEDDLNRLGGLLATVRPDVVILDPLRNAHPWDENLSHEAARLTGILDALIDRYHVALILAHHDRKRPPFVRRDAGTDRVRGSTALTGWLQFCLSLDPDPKTPDTLVAEWTKTRDAEIALPPMVLEFDRETLDFIASDRAPSGRVSEDAIVDAIFQNGGQYRGPDLVTAFVQGCGAGQRTMRDTLRAMVKDGALAEYIAPADKKTRAKTYALPDYAPEEMQP